MSLAIARGNTVFFEASFLDKNRSPASQTSATLHLSFKEDGVRKSVEIPMNSSTGGVFTASWDSSVADPGTIEWHIRSTGAGKVAEDGTFQLKANNANPNA